jgi:hypothetical protein
MACPADALALAARGLVMRYAGPAAAEEAVLSEFARVVSSMVAVADSVIGVHSDWLHSSRRAAHLYFVLRSSLAPMSWRRIIGSCAIARQWDRSVGAGAGVSAGDIQRVCVGIPMGWDAMGLPLIK